MEILAVISYLITVYLTYLNRVSCWIFSIITSILYFLIFKSGSDYMNMSLQIVFISQSILGIINWNKKDLKISHLDRKSLSLYLYLTLFLFGSFYIITSILEGTNPVLDSLTTSLSLVATYLMTLRKVESWIFWMVTDILYIFLFIKIGLYLSSILYFGLLIFCFFGYKKWNGEFEKI